ncbi:MAG: class I tRNA ligase family protein [Candidatus Pacebacteria bacterium]|nr:class I tRNA ligase family protein [Candidatus Paceibacterota bacterium]
MHEKFLQPYNPKDTEDRIYTLWEESGMFNPDHAVRMGVTDPKAEAFSIVLPPPNVTGQLHLGHAGMLTIEDIMVRFHRMDGKKTLWIPGTDHAAIATQSKVEKLLAKDNIRRHDLGRDAFLEHVQAFAHASQETILHQVKKMGASIDWSRLAFTLDDEREKAVHTAFIRMYHDGLIYQKERIVNWDPKGQTVISDDEVVHEERAGMMYTFKYSADFPIAIATTRPETKLGDTGVAVHPNDPRYQAYIGKTYTCTFAGQELEIRIVADEAVDPEFGTGAVGLTPAHSMTDWEIAERHDLPMKKVINEYAKMTVGMEGVLGQKTTVAREAIVAWIREQGLLEKEESITQNISTAERTGGIIEPLPKMQWWIDTEKKIIIPHNTIPGLDPQTPYSLKEVMLHVVQSGATNILPDRFEKVYYHWIEKLRPWNISRQIWYGHRIPVWYTKEGAPVLPKEQKLVFMRHGQSEYNVAGKIQGQYNAPLTETGREQARTAAASLVGTSFSKIICSDLDRAHETANIIAKELGLSVEVWPELREIDAGTLSGAPHHETLDTLAYVIQSGTGETLAELESRSHCGRKN